VINLSNKNYRLAVVVIGTVSAIVAVAKLLIGA